MANESNIIPAALPPVPAAPANPVAKTPRPAALPTEAAPIVDTVEISPRAKEAAKLVSALSQLPEVDPNEIQRAQQRVSATVSAPVAAAQLAEKLLTES